MCGLALSEARGLVSLIDLSQGSMGGNVLPPVDERALSASRLCSAVLLCAPLSRD